MDGMWDGIIGSICIVVIVVECATLHDEEVFGRTPSMTMTDEINNNNNDDDF